MVLVAIGIRADIAEGGDLAQAAVRQCERLDPGCESEVQWTLTFDRQRWLLKLWNGIFRPPCVEHLPGVVIKVADALSRLSNPT